MSAPFSLRKTTTELKYQRAKETDQLEPLENVPPLHSWQYWKLVPNAYPYDAAFEVHHMLLPTREHVSERHQLWEDERKELDDIIYYFVEPNYDVMMDNTRHKRSVMSVYHIHLCKYYESRKEAS